MNGQPCFNLQSSLCTRHKTCQRAAVTKQGLFKVAVVAPVILSEAKNPIPGTRALRFAQDDKKGLCKVIV